MTLTVVPKVTACTRGSRTQLSLEISVRFSRGSGFPLFASAIQTTVFPKRLLAGSGAGPRPRGAHSGTEAAALSPSAAISATWSVPATDPNDEKVAAEYGAPRLRSMVLCAGLSTFAAFAAESVDAPRFGRAGILSHAELNASTRDGTTNRKRPVKFLSW
jgi:hypothetical protein